MSLLIIFLESVKPNSRPQAMDVPGRDSIAFCLSLEVSLLVLGSSWRRFLISNQHWLAVKTLLVLLSPRGARILPRGFFALMASRTMWMKMAAWEKASVEE